ncbi:hypothetical protein Nepgr_033809 [Nepenthes gracilis]|uniref:Uncharacterized protein n=1 Tax=Nepenthes gracilis TaxID=150966 RepID=A0AAD3Y8M9_NEPGR|nr:hypothetical protein Nepgr_033809 [Nepenthes gracilis]
MKKDSMTFELANFLSADIPSTWKTMTAVYAYGKAKVIGESTFSMRKLGDLLAITGIPPAINQVECPSSSANDASPTLESWRQNLQLIS